MRQAVTRRYDGVASGEGRAPDLILIDGGKGQVASAWSALADLGLTHLTMIGVAKGEERKPGLESLIFPEADGRSTRASCFRAANSSSVTLGVPEAGITTPP